MSDDAPAHGYPRPHPLDLVEADAITVACAQERAIIRAQIASAVAIVRAWEPAVIR